MSPKNANQFLEAVSQDESLREEFAAVATPEEFLEVSHRLGYSFTADELKDLVKEQSQGVVVRRSTGVWKWLRSVNWV